MVDDRLARVTSDPRIGRFFAGADLARLKAQLVDQIGQASGGPQRYRGRDMVTAHAGLGIDGAAFDALLEDLAASLDRRGVGEAEKRSLLAVLEAMRVDIVER